MAADLMTIPEVATLLRLAERTVYDMCRGGRIPGVAKVGGQWRIERKRLLAWLAAGGEVTKPGSSKEKSN